jgi:hypothetical protein
MQGTLQCFGFFQARIQTSRSSSVIQITGMSDRICHGPTATLPLGSPI